MSGILEEFLLIFKPVVQGYGFQTLNRQIQQTHSGLFNVKNLLSGFVGYDIYSGLKQFGRSLVTASQELGAMTSRFYAITNSESLANEELQWTFDLAKKTAMGLKATADSYSIFYAATQKGLGTSGAREVFQDWTEVSRVLHLSEYQFERVTYALREMASKGAIYSQDLRMQIGTHVPNAMGLAEKAVNELGITGSNWFEDFRKASKGNQQLINQFILLFSKYAKEMYATPEALAKALKQPDAQITMLKNHWDELRYSMAKGQFGTDLVNVLSTANKLLDNIVKNQETIDNLYKIIKSILALFIALSGIKLFVKFAPWIKGTIKNAKKISSVLIGFFTRLRRYFILSIGYMKKIGSFLGKGKVLGAYFRRFGLFAILKRLLPFLGKGLFNLIPVIGQIVFLLWTAWDVINIIWNLLKVLFPKLGKYLRWIEFLLLEIWNVFRHPIISITSWFNKWFGKKEDAFSQCVIPNETQPNFSLNRKNFSYNDLFPYQSAIKRSGNTNVTLGAINNNVQINGSNLSSGELEDVINKTNNKFKNDIINQLALGVGNSNMYNYRY